MLGLAIVTPLAHEASSGRIVVSAPAATSQVDVRLGGVPVRVRLLSRREINGRVRLTLRVTRTSRSGAELEVVARDRARVELGRKVLADVHLLGYGAFAQPTHARESKRATERALAIARNTGGRVGISAECLGSGMSARANADRPAVAASTLKVAIVSAAFARDRASPTRLEVYPTYRAAIVSSDNDAANRILARVGGGAETLGASRVNELMARLQMRSSFLDGPYRLGGGPSLKRTSAADLERLARAVYLAARAEGPLARLGVSRNEARVLIGLMATETYPGLIRDHVPGPVAHKAGWLGAVQNDLALAFGTGGGTCLIGITTEGLSFAEADAVGKQVADRVLPLLGSIRSAVGSLVSFHAKVYRTPEAFQAASAST